MASLPRLWTAVLTPRQRHLVFPDGCVDLIFRGGASPELFWVGSNSRLEGISVPQRTCFVGVRFPPAVGAALANVHPRDLLDRKLRMDAPRLLEQLAGAPEETRARVLSDAVSKLDRPPVDPLVLHAVDVLSASAGATQVTALAERTGVSERTLHRRFVTAVGVSPKRFARIVRLGKARRAAIQGLSGAALALEAGYYDQSHLCHELADFGVTSADLARSR